MTAFIRADWVIPAGLIALSAVPVAAGITRLAWLTSGVEETAENARFFADPVPVVMHVLSVTPFAVLGAFQFSPGVRRRRSVWHRIAGRLVIPAGLFAAGSGLWMTEFYPPTENDGALLYVLRVTAGCAMILGLILGVIAIAQRDIPRHRAWMMRSYAIGLGAGTQAFTVIPWLVLAGPPGELARALLMGAGWAITSPWPNGFSEHRCSKTLGRLGRLVPIRIRVASRANGDVRQRRRGQPGAIDA